MKQVLIVAALTVLLAGCGLPKTIVQSEGLSDALDIAILYAIEQSGDRQTTAREIIEEAEELRTFIDFSAVTLEQIVDKARQRIAQSDKEFSEKAALNLVLKRAKRAISDKVSAGELSPDDKLTVNRLLDAIVASAQLYAD